MLTKILAIKEVYQEINYIFSGLVEWSHNGESCGIACIAHVGNVANCFQLVSELIDACVKYESLHHENK